MILAALQRIGLLAPLVDPVYDGAMTLALL